ncbi:hypothetical protein K1719_046242 [Acacia pycnantha]|nr:hypothetical protein K1719_046242 [Acacia pycnantha]
MSQQIDVTPFWNDIPHYEAIDEDYPNEDILDVESLSRDRDKIGKLMNCKVEFMKSKVVLDLHKICSK